MQGYYLLNGMFKPVAGDDVWVTAPSLLLGGGGGQSLSLTPIQMDSAASTATTSATANQRCFPEVGAALAARSRGRIPMLSPMRSPCAPPALCARAATPAMAHLGGDTNL